MSDGPDVGGGHSCNDGRGRRDSCFSCGHQGHGVTRCLRMDVSFPFLLPGWSVDMRNGRYRASRIRGDGRNYTPGKSGMVRAGGSASRIIGDRSATDPGGGRRVLGGCQPAWQQLVGCVRESRWTPNAHGFPALGSHSPASDGRREHPVPDDSGDVLAEDTSKVPTSHLEMGRGQMVPRGRRASVPYRGMRPAGVAGPALQETPVGVLGVM